MANVPKRDPLGPGRQMTPSNEYGRLISQKITSEGETYYHHYDALGSTASLTDSSEVVTDEYDYEAFGDTAAESGATPNPYLWVAQVGYRKDEETGLYDLRRRNYSPTAGRFTSEDPVRSDEENLYRYVGNDPAGDRDPSGMQLNYDDFPDELKPPRRFSRGSGSRHPFNSPAPCGEAEDRQFKQRANFRTPTEIGKVIYGVTRDCGTIECPHLSGFGHVVERNGKYLSYDDAYAHCQEFADRERLSTAKDWDDFFILYGVDKPEDAISCPLCVPPPPPPRPRRPTGTASTFSLESRQNQKDADLAYEEVLLSPSLLRQLPGPWHEDPTIVRIYYDKTDIIGHASAALQKRRRAVDNFIIANKENIKVGVAAVEAAVRYGIAPEADAALGVIDFATNPRLPTREEAAVGIIMMVFLHRSHKDGGGGGGKKPKRTNVDESVDLSHQKPSKRKRSDKHADAPDRKKTKTGDTPESAGGVPAPKELIEGFDFNKHLRDLIGDPPKGMVDPHAHHILFKKGIGAKQQALVEEGQAILRKSGIDPIYGKENLVWAPWRVSKQHGIESLREVVDKLRALDKIEADYDDFAEALKILGQKAASRTN